MEDNRGQLPIPPAPVSLVVELIRARAAQAPEALAVVCGRHSLSYGALLGQALALAGGLRALGIEPESRVAIYAPRSVETVAGIVGILAAGAAYVPLDPEYPADLLRFMLQDSGAAATLIPDLQNSREFSVSGHAIPLAETLSSNLAHAASELPAPAPDHLAYVLYTSGSTGRPKGVLTTHRNLAHSTRARFDYYEKPPARFLLVSSFAFDSSVAGLFWTLCAGGTLVLPAAGEERDPTALAALIAAQRITHTLCLPSLHELLLETGDQLDSLETVIIAGESCPSGLPAHHARRLPNATLFNEYGPTEACVWATVAPLGASTPVTIGQPIARTRIHLLDESGKPVAAGQPGEIHIGGEGIARGYLNQPDLTAARFLPDPSGAPGTSLYKTGDLARLLPTGDLEFLGRLDHQVKIRGYRIEPAAIEAVLLTHPAVRAAVVLARTDEPGSARLVAYVTPADCPVAALRQWVSEKLPAFMMPAVFIPLDALPLKPNGKVDRAALPAPGHKRPELASAYAAPRTPIEHWLADEWRSVLRLDRVGLHDKFFELGGDSLRAATLAHQLQHKLGEPVFVVALFEAPTVATLAAYLVKHYAAAVSRCFGDTGGPAAGRAASLTSAAVARVRASLPNPRAIPTGTGRPKTRRAIFVLAPPRSGTTLLRAMLAGHPGLFTGSELRLLGFETLAERHQSHAESGNIWQRSLIETVAAAKGCDDQTAELIVENAQRDRLSTADFIAQLQQWIAPREFVDKSPSYALDPAALCQAEEIFEDAFYIHLSRHPYEMVRSFEARRMDRVYLPQCSEFTPREVGELVWIISHQNIASFLSTIPAARQHAIRFADLVNQPRATMEALCEALGIPFDPALLDPYKHSSAQKPAGLHTADDPHFHEHAKINPEVAEGWRAAATDDFLSDLSWQLAETLGHEKPAAHRSIAPARSTPADAAIAIIGMAGRFPGARDIESFWKNLCDGVESIRPFTPDELRASGIDPAVIAQPEYVNAGAVLDDADRFAASFFGYTPREAELMDPQQRVFLECAWEAFEHAGQDVARFPGAVGVYAGLALNSYFQNNLATRPELAPLLDQYQLTIGNEKDFTATRVAHRLDLRGPAISVQTACSSSLVALHLACQSLRAGEIGMALVGGGRIRAPLHAGYQYIDGGIPSPDGHCRAFDAQARGCVAASGIATVVLKRLVDAQRDGDHIFGVIKATAINNDGAAKAGFTAPGIEGQAEVIARAHAAAGVSADTISYVEAHGTGTSIGDPIEITALTRAFRATSDKTGHCRIGSVKSNIGHLDAGAGVAGLIKTALALDRGFIPPSLHFEKPNPQIDFARSPFVVNAALTAWPRGETPRRAGVSSFGIGGTNAHALLEEAPLATSSSASRTWQVLVLSAKTIAALDSASANLARHLRENSTVPLADIAHTLQVGRREFEHRRILIARDPLDAAEALEKCDTRRVFTAQAQAHAPSVVFLFPGQGAQHPGMLRELFESEPVFQDALNRCSDLLRPRLDLLAALYPAEPSAEAMTETAIAQPAIFAVEYALAKLWESWGVSPAALVGHSVGEFAAACLAGVLTLEDALALLGARARLLQELPGGSMLAVRLSESELGPHLGAGIELAAVNSPRLCIVSGPTEAVAAFAEKMNAQDIACAPLQTSHAFHSAMVEPAIEPLTALARQTRFQAPRIPIHSTLTGGAADFTAPEYWARQLREPVRFASTVAGIDKDHVLLEVGPGTTLAPLARQTRGGTVIASQHAPGDRQQHAMLEALGRLWLAGVSIDWSRHRTGERRHRVALPTYPFERERYWVEPAKLAQPVFAPAAKPIVAPPSVSVSEPIGGDMVSAIQSVLHELSGVPTAQMRSSATLLELGFDSLFLTQATIALQKRFGVKVAFRQLFQELATIDALADFIQSRAPQNGKAPASAADAAPIAGQKAFGPFRPIDRTDAPELSPSQREHLDALTARYTARTAASKRLTEEHRPHLADPRSVSGFRPFWKEMVYPIVVERSSGSRMWDVDRREYIDFTMGFGTNLLGHSPKFVTDAIAAQLERGIEIGPQSPLAGEVARLLCEFSGMERAAFCNTGSEAVLAAVRVARTVTGRDRIATLSGYHGISDEFLVRGKTIDGQRRTVAIAPGIPDHVAREVLALDYGTLESLEILRAHAHELAAVLVEPVQSRNPELQPREFLHAVREITREAGVALIFDEVITGFRCHPGGAQAWFNVRADIVTYGKIIGGGMPIGALCGAAAYLDALDGGAWNFGDDSRPEIGVTFFAGTYVRHPLAMAASRAVLTYLKAEGDALPQRLNERTVRLVAELNEFLHANTTTIRIESFGSMFLVKFTADFSYGALLFFHLREKGIHAWDNRLLFLTTAHSEEDLAAFVRAFRESVIEMQAGGFLPERSAELSDSRGRLRDAPEVMMTITDAQQEIWLACQQGETASQAFNETWTLMLDGAVDAEVLRAAAQTVIDRHESLRSTFSGSGESVEVAPSLAIDIPLQDFSTLSDIESEARFAGLRAAEGTRSFDLTAGPLVALQLVRLAPEKHGLVFTAHHLICDGWSCDVFLSELASIYTARREGRPHQLLAPMTMRDYARFTREVRETPEFAAAADYWLGKYRTIPPTLTLPGDRSYPQRRSFRGASERLVLSTEFAESLRRFGAQQGATLFSVLLAGFKTLLFRLSGQGDLSVGVPSAGQNLASGGPLIGHCVNMLPLRSQLRAEQTFADLLTTEQAVVLDAFEHRRATFGWLLQQLSFSREPGRVPLIPVTFNVDPALGDIHFSGLQHRLEANLRSAFQFDLGFSCHTTPHGFSLACHYNTDLFDAATIRRWLGHYVTLLEGIVADPTLPLSQLPLLTSDDRRRLLEEWNDTAVVFPYETTLHQLFEDQVARTPDAVAVVCGDARVTYAELNRRAGHVADHLRALGVGPEGFVGICMQRSVEMMVALLGVLKAGGAYVPMDPGYPRERLAHMIADASLPVVLTQSALQDHLPGNIVRIVSLDREWQESPREGPKGAPVQVSADHPAYVLFTSGSTGLPKGAIISHRAICNHMFWMQRVFPLTADDRVLQKTPFVFDASVWEFYAPLLTGGQLVVAQPEGHRDGAYLVRTIAERGITILQLSPPQLQMILAEAALSRCSSLKRVFCGGEELKPELQAAFYESHPTASLHNLYGPTEATIDSTVWTCPRDWGQRPVPIGRPIDNARTYVVDANFQPVPVGVPGELLIAGAGLARGYLNRPELTAEKFIRDPFAARPGELLYRTGDLVRYLADGNIEYLGRIDEQVKIRGFRIELGEIESVLAAHPAIREAVVTVWREEEGENRLIAYAVATAETPTPAELRAHLRTRLPDYMLPAAFVFLDRLPLTNNGKLDRRALPDPDATRMPLESSFVPPRNAAEERVAEVWRHVLKLERVGVTDDFFHIGGHSLAAMQVISRLRGPQYPDVSILQIFERPTIAGFVESLHAANGEAAREEGVL